MLAHKQTLPAAKLKRYSARPHLRLVILMQTKHLGRLPVVNFAAGGVATPADAALMMQMGMDGVFVGSGIFKAGNPAKRAKAIVQVHSLLLCSLCCVSECILDPSCGLKRGHVICILPSKVPCNVKKNSLRAGCDPLQ